MGDTPELAAAMLQTALASGNFKIDDSQLGQGWCTQELRVTGSERPRRRRPVKGSNVNVVLTGPTDQWLPPKTVLANQRISLVGTGFSSGCR